MPDKIDVDHDFADTEYHFTDDLQDEHHQEPMSLEDMQEPSAGNKFSFSRILKHYKNTLLLLLVLSIIFMIIFFSLPSPSINAQQEIIAHDTAHPVTNHLPISSAPAMSALNPNTGSATATAVTMQRTNPQLQVSTAQVTSAVPSKPGVNNLAIAQQQQLTAPAPKAAVAPNSPPLPSTTNKAVIIVPPSAPEPYLADNYKSFAARLTSLEESNKNMASNLQNKIDQRFAELVTENKILATQLIDVIKKINLMQAQTNQLSRILSTPKNTSATINTHDNELEQPININEVILSPPKSSPTPIPSVHKTTQPEYIVQAIIPGRAWLKSKNDTTVTVANGDTLPNLGKVVGINPYSGSVQVDNGQKIITLLYGNN